MSQTAQTLIHALCLPLLAEDRPEAARTALVLRELGPQQLCTPQPQSSDHLAIRSLLALSSHPAAAGLLSAFDLIPWGINPVAAQIGDRGSMYVVANLMGPEGPVPCADLRMGLYYQRPNTYYGLHNHDADETYTILAGSAVWTAGDDTRLREAGEQIHHPSLLPHAFRTGPEGVLAFWRWSGDVNLHSYTMLDDPQVAITA
ncbi:dimethylsulfonioproprionate lyase family protein [Ruegeria marina]|uniref:Dimethlysulfonioproprionate lyase n=1 Tax=Ruegeria marina TaxID=639004 RepID=A0A1G6NCQ9_9RHOB|nr:dimethylsulfonioproprionate lyase family protein [Ruegeria marina]SDC65620.1 Dimethlysulfonioproprionate lyase [Ruegeria marina]